MKQALCFLLVLCCSISVYAAQAIYVPPPNASDLYLSLKNGRQVSLCELSGMSVKEWQIATGKKLTHLDKTKFVIAQRMLRKGNRPEGSIGTRMLALVAEGSKNRWRFHLGGFALGLLFG